jgi:hypothetical protein
LTDNCNSCSNHGVVANLINCKFSPCWINFIVRCDVRGIIDIKCRHNIMCSNQDDFDHTLFTCTANISTDATKSQRANRILQSRHFILHEYFGSVYLGLYRSGRGMKFKDFSRRSRPCIWKFKAMLENHRRDVRLFKWQH